MLESLGDEIATLAAHIHAATHRLLTLLARFDALRGWEAGGHPSCAHWLSWRTGIDLGAAREKVRTARALTALPEISASMARGELSFSKVRALTRVASPESEADLLALARESTTAHLERVVRGWKLHNRLDEQALERLRHQSRCFSVFPDESGMYVVKGRLDPEVAAVLLRAVEAAADALYWKGPDPIEAEAPITPEQRRADAVGLLAERALAAGLDREGGGPEAPIHAARAERYQVMLHVDARTLAEQPEAASELRAAGWVQTADGLQTADAARPADDAQNFGADAVREDRSPEGSGDRSHLSDGQRVSAETSRRLACDAAVVRVTHDLDGSVLDVGRRRRTIPAALRRALEVRDGGCRFPGCGRRFTDAHHVRHWADGGETALPNLLLLCRFHHRRVHEDGYRVSLDPDGRAVFRRPDGALVPHLPPLTRGSTHELLALHEALGIRPDWRTAAVRRE